MDDRDTLRNRDTLRDRDNLPPAQNARGDGSSGGQTAAIVAIAFLVAAGIGFFMMYGTNGNSGNTAQNTGQPMSTSTANGGMATGGPARIGSGTSAPSGTASTTGSAAGPSTGTNAMNNAIGSSRPPETTGSGSSAVPADNAGSSR